MKKILFSSLLFTMVTSLLGQSENWRYYYSMENVNDLAETDDFLWFATDHGVVKMNKSTLEKTYFTTQNSNLPAPHVISIDIDSEGLPWIGTYDITMARFDGEDWTDIVKIPEADSIQGWFSNWDPILYRLRIDSNDIIWLGTNDGLVRYDEGIVSIFNNNNVEEGFLRDVWDLTFDQKGSVFVSSFELLKYDTLGNWTNYASEHQELFAYGGTSLHCDGDGKIWYHNSFGLIASLKDTAWTFYDFFDGTKWNPSPPSMLTYFAEDSEGKILACAPGFGLYQLQDTVWSQYTTPQTEATNNYMTHYYVDKEERSWMVNNAAVSKYEEETLTNIFISEYPFFSNRFNKITGDEEGNVFILENNNQIVKYNEADGMKTYDEYFSAFETGNTYVGDIEITETGEKWIASNQGLFHHDGQSWEFLFGPDSETPVFGYNLASNANGHLVIPGYKKLIRYNGEKWDFFDTTNSPLNEDFGIYDVALDQNNVVWVFANDYINQQWVFKIYRLDGEDWDIWSAGDTGIPANNTLNHAFVDTNNHLWVTTKNSGIYIFDGQNWMPFLAENIDQTYVSKIYQDTNQNMYFCTTNGLEIFDGETWESINMENSPLLGDQINDIYKDLKGNLWISSYDEGINVYNENGFVVDIEEFYLPHKQQIRVFPNPASSFISIEVDAQTSSLEKPINIINSSGQVVKSIILSSDNTIVDIAQLPKGLYFATMQTKQEIQSVKFIVN
ncbi:MAG: T9SS type A sorting domain-containing protein [Bacteroidetes bacterium]|nr:T9SS type A sorting domain-containing protein [Bacteroidota bacterium]